MKCFEHQATLVGVILDEMHSAKWDDSDQLEALYEASNEYGRDTINLVLMYLCGWPLPTLLEIAAEEFAEVTQHD